MKQLIDVHTFVGDVQKMVLLKIHEQRPMPSTICSSPDTMGVMITCRGYSVNRDESVKNLQYDWPNEMHHI